MATRCPGMIYAYPDCELPRRSRSVRSRGDGHCDPMRAASRPALIAWVDGQRAVRVETNKYTAQWGKLCLQLGSRYSHKLMGNTCEL